MSRPGFLVGDPRMGARFPAPKGYGVPMNDYPIPYRGNLTWLPERTIYLARHGSHAYGTNIETSDEDFKGVAIPPREYFYGFQNVFEQAESKDPDFVVYDIRKFMRLAADCNPSIVEVLFVDDADVLRMTPAGRRLRDARALFLSRKVKHTFSGYAFSQMRRISTHYRWLKTPPNTPPTRAELGLPERTVIPADQLMAAQAAVQKKIDQWALHGLEDVDPATRIALQGAMTEMLAEARVTSDDTWRGAARAVGMDENFIRLLDLERQYTAKKREWDQYQNWKTTRNPARATIEEVHGFDTKHAMHLVRLMRMCREILSRGEVVVRRPDREELLAIRNGAWTYETLVAWAKREDTELEALVATSPLPSSPDRKALDALCVELVEESLR
jgi:uncharacterized protein